MADHKQSKNLPQEGPKRIKSLIIIIDKDFTTGRVLNDGKAFKENDKYPIVCDRGYYNTYTYINCVVGPSTYDPYSVPDCLLPESYQGCPKVGFPLMKPL